MNLLLIGWGLAGLLALAGGGVAWWQHGQIEQLELDRDRAVQAGQLCSDNTRILIEAGDEALARAETARDAAKAAADKSRRTADDIINAPRSVPGDACASADADIRRWLLDRRK